jgi:hypothetical protein
LLIQQQFRRSSFAALALFTGDGSEYFPDGG